MRKLCAFIMLVVLPLALSAQPKPYDTNSVIITRTLTKDLFSANSVPFMEPLVTTINATSNSRFFTNAKIPTKVNKPYFRFGVHGMTGFIRNDQLTYTPTLPTEKNPIDFTKYITSNGFDTVGLATSVLKRLFQKGIDSGKIKLPEKAATVFGNLNTNINYDPNDLANILQTDPEFALFKLLPQATQKMLDSSIRRLPSFQTLPKGQNIKTVYALVPQLEIGSYYGTELLLRYIPPIELDTSVGDFSFWGVGVRHSISQYFNDPLFDAAVQVAVQGTSLSNTVGITQSKLTASANFFNLNFHASKRIENWFDVFTGFSYERTDITADFAYTLPIETQLMLKLVRVDSTTGAAVRDPANGYPGDDVVQTSSTTISSDNFKWTFGINKDIGPVAIFADYSISRFNLFTGGISVRF